MYSRASYASGHEAVRVFLVYAFCHLFCLDGWKTFEVYPGRLGVIRLNSTQFVTHFLTKRLKRVLYQSNPTTDKFYKQYNVTTRILPREYIVCLPITLPTVFYINLTLCNNSYCVSVHVCYLARPVLGVSALVCRGTLCELTVVASSSVSDSDDSDCIIPAFLGFQLLRSCVLCD